MTFVALTLLPVAFLQGYTAIKSNGAIHPVIKRGQIAQCIHLTMLAVYLAVGIESRWYLYAMQLAGVAHAVLGTGMLLFWKATWMRGH